MHPLISAACYNPDFECLPLVLGWHHEYPFLVYKINEEFSLPNYEMGLIMFNQFLPISSKVAQISITLFNSLKWQ